MSFCLTFYVKPIFTLKGQTHLYYLNFDVLQRILYDFLDFFITALYIQKRYGLSYQSLSFFFFYHRRNRESNGNLTFKASLGWHVWDVGQPTFTEEYKAGNTEFHQAIRLVFLLKILDTDGGQHHLQG